MFNVICVFTMDRRGETRCALRSIYRRRYSVSRWRTLHSPRPSPNIDRSRLEGLRDYGSIEIVEQGSRANAARSGLLWTRSWMEAKPRPWPVEFGGRVRCKYVYWNHHHGLAAERSGDPAYRQLRQRRYYCGRYRRSKLWIAKRCRVQSKTVCRQERVNRARPPKWSKVEEGEEAEPFDDVPRIKVPNTLGAKASGESVDF